ncbi:MAG TPA: hypothetical protein VNA24_10425 [Hyalangium sp.]|nr:hypothetical protein [Hyalangium sp.]
MSSPRLATLLLCVLLPLSGLAQTPAPEEAPSPAAVPPPLVPAQEEPETAPAQPTSETPRDAFAPRPLHAKTDLEEWRPYRIPLQILGGSAGVGAGMLLAAGIVSLDSMNCDGPCNFLLLFFGLGIGAGGITLGPTLAVWGIGEALEDRGRFWPTLAGAALGTLSSFVAQTQLSNKVSDEALIAVIGLGPLLGTLTAYELTRRGPLPSKEASHLQVLPVVSMSPGGGLMGGLAGRF